jgi:superfamily I DNA/RNA helicase
MARLAAKTTAELVDRVEDYRARETARLVRKDAPASRFESLDDRCDCLAMLATQAGSLDDLAAFIRRTFDDAAGPGVVLSSVHRAKGLEADRVFVLDTGTLPMARRGAQPWQKQQELNLAYVAVTRSKDVIVFEDSIPAIFQR